MAADFNVYMEHPAVAAMSESVANDWRSQHRVQVSGGPPAPNPVRSFLEASFPEFITADIEAVGFDRPTPIQSQSWPIALSGRDVIGLAATGSGKTLCFALPMIVHINAQPHLQPGDGPIALVLSPTRELALQTKGECDRFGASSGVTNTAIYGGVPKGPQERDLRQGVEIVIATPGRLIDFMDVRLRTARRGSPAHSRPPLQAAGASALTHPRCPHQ
jgi:ATP-dependent RNA helicase DDX5/DBP2